ncbi:hypothetical protein [Catenovulum sediminis]|uniref:Uncharacterized protein n=1 Tax=Catenovulum sediminis TaxID=1740262 RepID=A0ABV1RCH1_9ALTE|nr:hypothetical protein [Catenovulum sediminis]
MIQAYKKAVLFLIIIYTTYIFLPLAWPYLYREQTVSFLGLAGLEAQLPLPESFNYVIPCLYLVCCFGLYSFFNSARVGFVILIICNLTVGSFGLGYSASAFLDTALGYFISLLEGGILVMSYVTSAAEEFKKRNLGTKM